ncbi:MAG: DUF4465 domain-containing protein [Alistipes sp.]|nr:DUF4465 domain-containing protein [Alistipes sp.]
MRKLMFAIALMGVVGCDYDRVEDMPIREIESFENTLTEEYALGYENDLFEFEYFYNEEYAYWGGFAQSRVKDADPANGLFANQYAVFNDSAASGESFLIYYYDSYNEPCDIRLKEDVLLTGVQLNLTTYTYASITNEEINDFARVFEDGDYLKVVFTGMKGNTVTGVDEFYVVDFRDGKREMATDWTAYSFINLGDDYNRIRVTIETTDVGEWGANTPLYIALDNLTYLL